MRTLVAFLALLFPLLAIAQDEQEVKNVITISGDTVYNNSEPYCLLQAEGQVYIIRNFLLERMAQIEPVIIGADQYYQLDVSMLYKTFYIKPMESNFVEEYLHYMVINGVLDDEGYYDEFGTRSLVAFIKEKGITITYEELEAIKQKNNKRDWKIAYEHNKDNDSTIIKADDKMVAYYKTTRWEDLGADRYAIARGPNYAHTRYYIYALDNSLVAEIRKPWDGITMTVILAANNEELKFRYLPKDKNIVTLTTKILLAKGML
ncbi:MAG: hypothetical protein R2800_04665 [Flavipsychrobacter sp.]